MSQASLGLPSFLHPHYNKVQHRSRKSFWTCHTYPQAPSPFCFFPLKVTMTQALLICYSIHQNKICVTVSPRPSFCFSPSLQAQANNTNIEPGSTISVPFTVATTANGVVNDSATGTFTVQVNNDRGYSLTAPDTVTIAAGKANGTVTLTAPASAVSGTDVTLTIQAENTAANDINFTVLRLSIVAKVRGGEQSV